MISAKKTFHKDCFGILNHKDIHNNVCCGIKYIITKNKDIHRENVNPLETRQNTQFLTTQLLLRI